MQTLPAHLLLIVAVNLGFCEQRPAEDPCKRRGGTSAHEQYCDQFYQCIGDDQSEVRTCPNGLVYAGRKSLFDVCGYEHEFPCEHNTLRRGGQQTGHSCPLQGGVAPHELYCDLYQRCFGGEVHDVSCPNGMVFWPRRPTFEYCTYPSEAPYACLNKQLANEPSSTEHCEWLYGIFGHETSCTRYWTCWNGTATEQFCIGGLLYNEKTHGCDWPDNVDDCQKHPLCAEDSNGNVPLGKSCERYWSCQGGYPRLMRCPATLVFQKSSASCVHPPTADCDVPPIEEPEEEEEKEEQAVGVGQQQQADRGGRRGVRAPAQQISIVDDVYDDDGDFATQQLQRGRGRRPGHSSQEQGTFSRRGQVSLSGDRTALRGPAVPSGAILVN